MVKSTKPEVATAATEEIGLTDRVLRDRKTVKYTDPESGSDASPPEAAGKEEILNEYIAKEPEAKESKKRKSSDAGVDLPDGGEKEEEASTETEKADETKSSKKSKKSKKSEAAVEEPAKEIDIMEKSAEVSEKNIDPVEAEKAE